MLRNKQLIGTIIMATLVTACTHRMSEQVPAVQNNETEKQTISMNNNRFAFDLLRQMPVDDNNVVFSPFSISTALAMTYAGARENTMKEMARVMHFQENQHHFHGQYQQYLQSLMELAEDSICLNIANSLWAQTGYHFLESYFEIIKKHYHSSVFPADFLHNREQAAGDINQWVYNETNENIPNLISQDALTRDTRLVLVNAIHFLGEWLRAFDKERTHEDQFYLRNNQQVKTDFMYRGGSLPYYEDDQVQVLEIPYKGDNFSMLFILPQKDVSLEDAEARLDAEFYSGLTDRLKNTQLRVFLPKFKLNTRFDLEHALVNMGMKEAFTMDADLSGMTGQHDLKIDKVIHQAMIEVDEKGTEAAAATAVVVVMKTSINEEEPKTFRANRPFLFLIKDNAYQSILFAGRVMDPTKQ